MQLNVFIRNGEKLSPTLPLRDKILLEDQIILSNVSGVYWKSNITINGKKS